MKRLLMKECWNDFAQKCVPRNASGEQRRQLRKAFYAGAHQILFRVVDGLAPENEPTDEDLKMMNDVYNELRAEFGELPREWPMQ
jgi:hypothetical protein